VEPELIVDEYGTKRWRLNDLLHREDGPAVEWTDGHKAWYLNGKRHRKDGPAIEWANGHRTWYLNDKHLSKEDFTSLDQIIKMQAFDLFTPQEIIVMRKLK